MSFNDRSFAYAQLGYILTVTITLLVLPGASFWPTLIALCGVWIAVALCNQATAARNSAGWWTLLTATTLLAIGAIANIHFFTTAQGATTSDPVLLNTDARANFDSAMFLLGQGKAAHAPCAMGYPLFIAGIWRITGITVVAPIVANMLMVLLTIIASGTIATRVLSREQCRRQPQWLQACAMIMTASICYLLNTGTIMIKDAGICLSMALAGLGLTSLRIQSATYKTSLRIWGAFAVGTAGVAIFRLNYLLLLFIAVLIITPWRHENWNAMRRAAVMIGVIAISWLLTNWLLVDNWNHYTLGMHFPDDAMSGYFTSGQYTPHLYHDQMLGDYYHSPVWHRLLWLPINAALLYFIPFPWNFTAYLDFGYTYAFAKFSYPWYAVGGMIIYHILYMGRRSSPAIMHLTLAALTLWLIPAYLTAGSVSRYILPLLTWLIPAAVAVADSQLSTRRFRIYALVYGITIAIVLIVCHHLQNSVL